MAIATLRPGIQNPVRRLRWGRILLGAVLLEVALFAILIPIGLVFGMPSVVDANGAATDPTVFFIAVPIGCFVLGVLAGSWVARPLPSRHVPHGALTGAIATLLYLALCAVQPGSIAGVVAAYGAPLFYLCQALRIAGCTAGAAYSGKRI